MKTRAIFTFLYCLLLLAPTPVHAQENGESISNEKIQERRTISENGEFLYVSPTQGSFASTVTADGPSLAEALDVKPAMLQFASISGPGEASAVLAGLGVIQPIQGSTFAVLSTGIVGTSRPEPGTDFPPAGSVGDEAKLTLILNIPPGFNLLRFDYNFLSAEHPEYVGSIYDDTFSAILTDSSGVREITRASVNSSAFYDASQSNAGGSGFDIFTEDPADVDEVFGTGLPDAGVTGFKSVSIAVAGSESVTLEFSIKDLSDGILDSAVILDNLVISSLEVVDPNPKFLADGQIMNNPSVLAQGGELREAAAADGVTRVLLRNTVTGPGAVEFCMDGNAPQDGGLAALGDTGQANCINAPVESTAHGYMAFAIYQTPDEFNRGGDEALFERPLGFSARFTPTTGNEVETDIPFKLVRPPVVLVHGLWSNGATWGFPLIHDPRFKKIITPVDYKATNASYFADNALVPFTHNGIEQAIAKMRLRNIAATQVDIAGHSMGGILSRNYVNTDQYKRNDNFNAGDVHKLITFNTPHTGSPLANLLIGLRDNPIIGGTFTALSALSGHPIDRGAIDDLATGSAAIDAIQSAPVPGHALVGTGGSDLLTSIPGEVGAFYTLVNFFADTTGLFQGLQHDGIVGRKSQEGGMSINTITVFGGLDSIHTQVTGSAAYSSRLVELLNSPATGSSFAEFPDPTNLLVAADLSAAQIVTASSAIQSFSESGLSITTPASGTVVSPGSTVNVVVEPDSGVAVDQVLLVGPSVAIVDDSTPFSFNLTIPAEKAGAFTISATGKNSNGDFFGSNSVTLQVNPQAALETMTIIPQDPIFFTVGENRSLTVLGTFDDGIERDITNSTAGTEYLTSDSAVVTVSPAGVVTAVGVGTATVVAMHGPVQDSVSASVNLANQTPLANAGPDQMTTVGSPVTLDGSSSFDPDNGPEPLGYAWLQIAGPTVSLEDSSTENPTFTPPSAGNYTFSLIVRDGQTDSLPDNVVITVFDASALPDLVVQEIVTTENNVQVVIKNQGSGPVLPGHDFWVDVYIDPDTPPTSVNDIWEFVGDKGLVWGVVAPVVPLPPGATVTLTIGDAYYWPMLSNFPNPLPPDTPIYAQVDSANANTTYGGVLESHETAGGAYNNILGPVLSTTTSAGQQDVQLYLPFIVQSDASSNPESAAGVSVGSAEEKPLPVRP